MKTKTEDSLIHMLKERGYKPNLFRATNGSWIINFIDFKDEKQEHKYITPESLVIDQDWMDTPVQEAK